MKDLTICVPTFNRDPFLAWTLDKTVADFPDTKIIVSDNGKTGLAFPGGMTGAGVRSGTQ